MRTRRPKPSPAIPFLCLTLAALFGAWAGCSASGSSLSNSGSTGMGGAGPGAGGGGGAGVDGGGLDGGDAGDATDGAPMCTPTQKLCDGMCVAQDDPSYGCSATFCTACPSYPNAMAACSAGACVLGSCSTGFKNCNGNDADGCETNTQNDPMNCGVCGAPCVLVHATATCTDGTCTVGSCDMGGWTDCSEVDGGVPDAGDGGTPVDIGCGTNTQNDPMNCGVCGKVCPGQETCQNGVCGLTCPKGFANCPGDPLDTCATPLGTNKNCNFCGDTCNLPNANSQCMPMGTTNVCNLNTCNAGWANCDMIAANGCETNTQTDANNCDSCGNVCPSGPHSTAVCTAGGCSLVCDPGYLDCNHNPSDGCEVDGNVDLNNCGTCGDVCTTPNATPGCAAGQCTIVTCNSGFQDCDLKVPDGCEVNTKNDPDNCGMCGTICSTPNATPGCTNGMCSISSCNPGFLDCDTQVPDGCEINGSNNVNDCGVCGKVCSVANGNGTCTGGNCAIASCNPGFQDCDKVESDGCEANVNTSTANCGSCGNACNTPNATPACNNGGCIIGMCNPGFQDCDHNPSDGCEINTQNDPNNCGGCGTKCMIANGTAACLNGMCVVGTCNPGYTDCDGNPANGCEVDTGADPSNCGTCGHLCNIANGTASCTSGACSVAACNPGFQDCDHSPVDGCEVNTAGDPNNCGGCNHQCFVANGTAGCSASNCTVASCDTGFGDCNHNPGDGCETNTTGDANNCGGCGNVCLAECGGAADHVTAASCTASACHITGCASEWTDNDLVCSNGCECADSTTPTTCTGGAAHFLGTLSQGTSITPFSSNLFPASPNAAYFSVTFTQNNTNTSFHPEITITDPLGEFVMDITTDCSTLISTCNTIGDTANSGGVTTWEMKYTAGDPTSKTPGGVTNFDPIPLPGTGGTVYIKVYRKEALTKCSNAYTLNVKE